MNNFEFAVLAVAELDRKVSHAERAFYAEREREKVPKLHKASLAFEPVMLKSALFRPASGPRATFEAYTEVRTHGAHRVEYIGEELRQDDLRVLLMLIKDRSGQRVDVIQQFVPRTFCREVLAWADSSDSVAKLRACIIRLHTARVRVTYADGGVSLYSFVSDAELTGDKWSVWLSVRLMQMFEKSVTYLPREDRLGLRDGLTSWLYGYVKADACLVPFALSDFRELSGSMSYEQKAFNRVFKASLEQLKAAGLIEGFEMATGKVRIRK